MLKKQWDKLPIGTVLLYLYEEEPSYIEVKTSKNETTLVFKFLEQKYGLDEGTVVDYTSSVYKDLLENLQLAPKWIQELFKIKGG